MLAHELTTILTDHTLDCSKYPIIARADYAPRMAWLHNHRSSLLSILRNNYWDYIQELVAKLPIKHTPLKFLTSACKNIQKSADTRAATMVYHYLSELSAVIKHIMITENNADTTINYSYSEFDSVVVPLDEEPDLRAINAFVAIL